MKILLSLTEETEILEQQIKIYKIAYKRKIELESPHKEIYADVDINLIRRSINNLMNNALKHVETSKTITITCKLENGNLYISVHNKGKAVPQEILNTIFKRYYKVSASFERMGNWTGICKKSG